MIFKFRISGKENEIVEFEKEFLDILRRVVGNTEMNAYEIHFCVHEAILNVLQHTYHWDNEPPIDVRLDITDEEDNKLLEISIRDFGAPIEKKLTPPKKIEQFQLRQRGLYMIGKIMDEVRVEPQEKQGNVTYMKKWIKNSELETAGAALGK